MSPRARVPEAASLDRMAAGFMAAHLLVQLVGGMVGAAMFVGLGGMVGLVGALEEELAAVAFGGLFGGLGVLLGLFLLVQAVPAAFATWGLWRGSVWRQAASVVASSLALTHFPVGTVLGVGTLWCTWKAHEAQKKATGGG